MDTGDGRGRECVKRCGINWCGIAGNRRIRLGLRRGSGCRQRPRCRSRLAIAGPWYRDEELQPGTCRCFGPLADGWRVEWIRTRFGERSRRTRTTARVREFREALANGDGPHGVPQRDSVVDRRGETGVGLAMEGACGSQLRSLSLIHISEPTRPYSISYAVF